jgi:hypothetical protein
VLVVKATNVATSDASQKWTYFDSDNEPKVWDADAEDLDGTDRVIIIEPGSSDGSRRTLVTASTSTNDWNTTYGARGDYVPASGYNFVYGVNPDTDLRMPFNRADYYLADPTSISTVPTRCAPNTTSLFKAVINQSNGARGTIMPLLDCVANMQVVFNLDRDGDGVTDGYTDVLTDLSTVALTAEQIRDQVKEVRVYILAHEGQKDPSYTHPETVIRVGEAGIGGELFDVETNVNYRWKLYILVVKPRNLR